jgi:hypothetical protein
LAAIVAGEDADGDWMSEHLIRPHPVILEQSLRSLHASNLKSSLGQYLPRFAEMAPISDWGALSPFLPTTQGDETRLEWFTQLALAAAKDPPWADLVRIEWAECRESKRTPIATAELVSAIRAMDPLTFDDTGRKTVDFGTFVRLESTWFDVHWISGHSPANSVPFGPARTVFFYTGARSDVRSAVFGDLDGLAISLCFSGGPSC